MADQWAQTTWSVVASGDFVKIKGVIWRCNVASDGRFVLENRTGATHEGFPALTSPVLVRVVKNGERTPAGKRNSDLSPEGESALKAKLGAELLAFQDTSQKTFQPWVLPERFDAQSLASHLFMFHELYCGDVKAKDGAELRAAHRAFHAADVTTQPETARRIPHVHDERAFQEAL